MDKSSCGVGFIASLENRATFANLAAGLRALVNLEHRGGGHADLETSDGAGIMTDIPYDLFDLPRGYAVANLFVPRSPTLKFRALKVFEESFHHLGLHVDDYREPPLNYDALSELSRLKRPDVLLAFIRRPSECTTRYAFEKRLYAAKQATRSRLREEKLTSQFFFTSLSAGTIIYKALTPSHLLAEYYLDLKDPRYATRFTLVHRRFSTNTSSSWDRAQPFRMVAHNGEINTIAGNRAWAYAREKALGIREDELLTHRGISDSGSVNEMIEALMFRSSIAHVEDILAIMMPQANNAASFYKFWSRAMEPWDGPALFTFCDGRTIGARLDRSGFRPCRWARTAKNFYLSSEAGSFEIPEAEILAKGALSGGASVSVDLSSGRCQFKDASVSRENEFAVFDPGLTHLARTWVTTSLPPSAEQLRLFNFTEEDVKKIIIPSARDGREPIGSMGDTARLAVFSSETRSLFDYFFQNFAQVTNPPLDYLREKVVTDLSVVLGRKPNIFEPKELIPAKRGLELEGPVLSLGQMAELKARDEEVAVLDATFSRAAGSLGMRTQIAELKRQVQDGVQKKITIFIVSDRGARPDRPPIPTVLVVRALDRALNDRGMRLRASFVIETGEVKNSHDLSVLIGFGAAAVCPYLALELVRSDDSTLVAGDLLRLPAASREARLVESFEGGLLKIIAKMGVSVLQSYQGSELFTILGFGPELHEEFFPRQTSRIGGLNFDALVAQILRDTVATERPGLLHNHLLREHPQDAAGEKHSMTLRRSKLIHRLVDETGEDLTSTEIYRAYLASGEECDPISIRHLLAPKVAPIPLGLETVAPRAEIFRTFGSGAMSFGAISAEAQRDVILAMRDVGARSNSGEGGENPFYFSDGVRAHTKQIGSARFGVTAEYLVSGEEIQIKIAQGAKPGEGGQLMACKVGPETARARFSLENVDLISPPPMHDIYSIEDLKQLIFELRQLKPDGVVSVKLVSGDLIGTIAVGVAKAGADVIHIAGHDGGTGAATVTSMKHAGLPWEIGLVEVHHALLNENLRHRVALRVDGGLSTGRDVVTAAMLGADQFDFGKLLLVAEGCVMARVCEKNTCPTGIATHDPKFKKRYKGSKEKIVSLLAHLADDVRRHLAQVGVASLHDLVGRKDLLEIHPRHRDFVGARNLNLDVFLGHAASVAVRRANPFCEEISELNRRIVLELQKQVRATELVYDVKPRDRAILATLNGLVAQERSERRFGQNFRARFEALTQRTRFTFRGSAGQGFAVFTQDGFEVRLEGEANDSVAKSMSGGKVTIVPAAGFAANPAENTIIGNCALYGATGGSLYVLGVAGDRFAIRNSGATAVVEGVGMQACEYMTRGHVLVLGKVGQNVGAGMTGGTLFLRRHAIAQINHAYLEVHECDASDLRQLTDTLEDYALETGSVTAKLFLSHPEILAAEMVKGLPKKVLALPLETKPQTESAAESRVVAGA